MQRSPYIDIPGLLDSWEAQVRVGVDVAIATQRPAAAIMGQAFMAELRKLDPLNQVLVAAHAGARFEDLVVAIDSDRPPTAEQVVTRRLMVSWCHQVAPRLRSAGLAA
jgi:hypothetical protein